MPKKTYRHEHAPTCMFTHMSTHELRWSSGCSTSMPMRVPAHVSAHMPTQTSAYTSAHTSDQTCTNTRARTSTHVRTKPAHPSVHVSTHTRARRHTRLHACSGRSSDCSTRISTTVRSTESPASASRAASPTARHSSAPSAGQPRCRSVRVTVYIIHEVCPCKYTRACTPFSPPFCWAPALRLLAHVWDACVHVCSCESVRELGKLFSGHVSEVVAGGPVHVYHHADTHTDDMMCATDASNEERCAVLACKEMPR